MKRNSLRVVCNPYTNQMSYYFQNELGEWSILSESSPLSRQYFTNTSIKERGPEIIKKIDEIYNRKNKGVNIFFEGTTDNFKSFSSEIATNYKDRDLRCILGTTKIAVLGKKSVGKTTLIEGLEKLKGLNYDKTMQNNYIEYRDELNHAHWYEIEGIDLGKDNVNKAFQTITDLSQNGLSTVIYCISATSGRIEDIEKQLIHNIEKNFHELKVLIVLTMCYKENLQEIIDEIKKMTEQAKLVTTLAKEYRTGLKDTNGSQLTIAPFGLELVSEYVFEGR